MESKLDAISEADAQCELDGKGKTSLTIDMNEKNVGISATVLSDSGNETEFASWKKLEGSDTLPHTVMSSRHAGSWMARRYTSQNQRRSVRRPKEKSKYSAVSNRDPGRHFLPGPFARSERFKKN